MALLSNLGKNYFIELKLLYTLLRIKEKEFLHIGKWRGALICFF